MVKGLHKIFSGDKKSRSKMAMNQGKELCEDMLEIFVEFRSFHKHLEKLNRSSPYLHTKDL